MSSSANSVRVGIAMHSGFGLVVAAMASNAAGSRGGASGSSSGTRRGPPLGGTSLGAVWSSRCRDLGLGEGLVVLEHPAHVPFHPAHAHGLLPASARAGLATSSARTKRPESRVARHPLPLPRMLSRTPMCSARTAMSAGCVCCPRSSSPRQPAIGTRWTTPSASQPCSPASMSRTAQRPT